MQPKPGVRGNVIVPNAYIRNKNMFKITNLSSYLKKLKRKAKYIQSKQEKENHEDKSINQWNRKVENDRKKNQWGKTTPIKKKINKIDKSLARLMKIKRKKTRIIYIRNETGDVTSDPTTRIMKYVLVPMPAVTN